MKKTLLAALAAVGLSLVVTAAAPAQTVMVNPGTGQPYVQYYTPYTYGSTSFYYYPNTGYTSSYGLTAPSYSPYGPTYRGPMIYGPGYYTNTPYPYTSYFNGNYNYATPYSTTTTRTYRWWR